MASSDAAMAAGNEAFLELDYEEAVLQYSKAVEAGVQAAFGRRGAVFLAMQKFREAATKDAADSGHDIEVGDDGRSLSVCIAMKNGSEFQYEMALYGTVQQQVQVAVEEYNVEVTLTKRDAVQWPTLEPRKATAAAASTMAAHVAPKPVSVPVPVPAESVGAATAAAASASSTPAQPAPAKPQPKPKAKNWDALEAELDSDGEEDKPQGEAALQALFRQIYEKADPDTRRAMVKSFQTSGGTVLSTNWGEVAKKNYEAERPAPEGVQWKKYDD